MKSVLNFLATQYIGYFWLIVAIIFLFVEVLIPGLFIFIAFSIGTICASLFAFLNYPFIFQCIVALLVTLIAFFFFRFYFKKVKTKTLSSNIDALIGQEGIVIKKITLEHFGQVKIGGEIWAANIDIKNNGEILNKGEKVKVVKVLGNRLIVKSC